MEERMYGQETSIDGPADSDDDDRFSPSDWLTRTSDQPEAILEAEDRQHLEGEGLQTALAALDPRSPPESLKHATSPLTPTALQNR